MRPRNQSARERLLTLLARQRGQGMAASELAGTLCVSNATLHRLLHELGGQAVHAGRARRTRHALRRALRGQTRDIPFYAVDATGHARPVAALTLVEPQGSLMPLAGTGWPVPPESADGWWDGLPYPMLDMRPQGYLGRQLARTEHRVLDVPSNPDEWSDDDVVYGLSMVGADTSGDLIVGDTAFERWQRTALDRPAPLKRHALGAAYARLAEQAVASGVPGSSAAGEFPKFPARRELAGSATPHVLVKFSGADSSAAVRRWAELLVCEHLALESAAALPGVTAARSRVVEHAGRTFLEVERFDRQGELGRSPLVSLATLDAALLGAGTTDWTRLAERLSAAGWLAADDAGAIARLWWFGRLIANTDMHTGNLSLRPRDGRLVLAPAYDMLPMLYAPLPGGEVPPRRFEAALPLPTQREPWHAACAASVVFWTRAAAEGRLSEDLRGECTRNAAQLQRLANRV